MIAPVSLFNTSPLQLSVTINNGNQVPIGSAAPPAFVPQPSGGVSFDPNRPSPGVLGPGSNSIVVVSPGSPQPVSFWVNVPTNAPIQSLQLYLCVGGDSGTYVLLNGGFYVASGSGSA